MRVQLLTPRQRSRPGSGHGAGQGARWLVLRTTAKRVRITRRCVICPYLQSKGFPPRTGSRIHIQGGRVQTQQAHQAAVAHHTSHKDSRRCSSSAYPASPCTTGRRLLAVSEDALTSARCTGHTPQAQTRERERWARYVMRTGVRARDAHASLGSIGVKSFPHEDFS